MRVRSILVGLAGAAVLMGGPRTATADCADPFRDPNDILDFHLRTTSAIWTSFEESDRSDASCDDQYPYFSAEFRCGEQEPYLAIEFRRKRDRSETRAKLPIKLDFNRAVSGQRWPATRGELGFRKLSLNSGQSDDAGRTAGSEGQPNPGTMTAILTEHLAWRLMRQELPEVSGVAYARLTVHFTDTGASRYQGIYVLIEDIDRTAVRARFGVATGLLVKTTDIGCVDEVVFDDGPPNGASDLFAAWLADDAANFPDVWYARTDQAMHLDPLLRQEALRELLANTGDTVLGNRNNYFALDLPGDRRWFLPWDLDDMFRPFPQVRAAATPLWRNCTGGNGCRPKPIGLAIRDNPEIRRRYLEIMCQLSNGVAHEAKLLDEVAMLDALLRPVLAAEVETVWAPMGRDPLDGTVEGTYAAEVERMKSWIPARIQAVRALIEAEGVSCPPACEEGATMTCEYLGKPSARACTGGRWGACQDPMPAVGTGGTGVPGGALPPPDAGADAEPEPEPEPCGKQGGCGCITAPGAGDARALILTLLLSLVAYGGLGVHRRR